MPDVVIGIDSPDYTLVTADLGADIYCKVTATNASGSASADSNTVGPVTAAGGGDEAETTAWAAAVVTAGGTVSAGRKTLVNTLIAGLKTDGVWTLLDRLWILAAENGQSALVDLKGLDTGVPQTGLSASLPTFTANRGYTFDGQNRIDTTYNPSTDAINYALNSACMFLYDRTSGADVGFSFGARVTSPGVYLSEFQLTDTATGLWRLNDAAAGFANTNTQGFWIATRTAAATFAVYKNGNTTPFATSSTATTGIPTIPYWIGDVNDGAVGLGGVHDQIACAGCGGGLTATQAAALTTRIEVYMDDASVGAGII